MAIPAPTKTNTSSPPPNQAVASSSSANTKTTPSNTSVSSNNASSKPVSTKTTINSGKKVKANKTMILSVILDDLRRFTSTASGYKVIILIGLVIALLTSLMAVFIWQEHWQLFRWWDNAAAYLFHYHPVAAGHSPSMLQPSMLHPSAPLMQPAASAERSVEPINVSSSVNGLSQPTPIPYQPGQIIVPTNSKINGIGY